MKKHINIPIFIPHLGCPHDCVFCNQRSISGRESFDPGQVRGQIDTALSTIPSGAPLPEIAYFGGSFTGIDRPLMLYLLGLAAEYVDRGKAQSIRLSTRPDMIDEDVLDILSRYPVRTVELGIQSMDAAVLAASRRGHTAEDSRRAARLLAERGFAFIGQMMIGLPCSDGAKEVATAREICGMGASGARIYPTVVFRGTRLCGMSASGEYVPLGLADAVERTKNALAVFAERNVPCIRIGLQSGENLTDGDSVFAGDYHSAVGELAAGELYFEKICGKIEETGGARGKNLIICVPPGEVSKAVGQNRKNKIRLTEKYGFRSIKVLEKSGILRYNVTIDIV